MTVVEKVEQWMYKHRSKSYTTMEVSIGARVDRSHCLRALKVLEEHGSVGRAFDKWYWEYKAVLLSPLMLSRALKRCRELEEEDSSPLLDIKQELNDIRANRAAFNSSTWYEPNVESWCEHVEKKLEED